MCECLDSIRLFHPTNTCVVVIDFTSNKSLVESLVQQYPAVIFERETAQYPADMQLLKYFKEKHYFDTAILLQDSMRVKKEFIVEDVRNIQYIWHFNNHRTEWNSIKEPVTDYNTEHKIVTHDDLVHHVIARLPPSDFAEYCKEIYPKKNLWSGCFGGCCIITYDFLLELDIKTHIIELESTMTTNRLRRVIESIFALACSFTNNRYITDSFDGLYFDGTRGNNMKGTAIHKVSFDRQ